MLKNDQIWGQILDAVAETQNRKTELEQVLSNLERSTYRKGVKTLKTLGFTVRGAGARDLAMLKDQALVEIWANQGGGFSYNILVNKGVNKMFLNYHSDSGFYVTSYRCNGTFYDYITDMLCDISDSDQITCSIRLTDSEAERLQNVDIITSNLLWDYYAEGLIK